MTPTTTRSERLRRALGCGGLLTLAALALLVAIVPVVALSPSYFNPASFALCAAAYVGGVVAIALAFGRRERAPSNRMLLALAALGGLFIIAATIIGLAWLDPLHLQIVLGFGGLAAGVASFWLELRRRQRQRRIRRNMLCEKCEYPMRDVLTETCPECGHFNRKLDKNDPLPSNPPVPLP